MLIPKISIKFSLNLLESCYCKTRPRGRLAEYGDVYLPHSYGEYVAGFQVCATNNAMFSSKVVAGLDLYYSDGTKREIHGCLASVDPFPLVQLSRDEFIEKVYVTFDGDEEFSGPFHF